MAVGFEHAATAKMKKIESKRIEKASWVKVLGRIPGDVLPKLRLEAKPCKGPLLETEMRPQRDHDINVHHQENETRDSFDFLWLVLSWVGFKL